MDQAGHAEILNALKSELRDMDSIAQPFHLDPSQHDFLREVDPLERAPYLDVITPANPNRVFSAFRKFHFMERNHVSYTGNSPRLRVLDITNDGDLFIISFEDMTER